MSKKVYKTMDGNEAASYISYAFTEVATIFPITPSSPMATHVDVWAANGMKNIFGQEVHLAELESEAGACGAMHGALESGSLATTYTASQGLMLMIPPMYRIAGMGLPAVMHVASRVVSTNSISIFGDHSDVMACRQTGWAQLASGSVQECMDLGAVAHLSAIKSRVPVQHFFDGFRTSHELQKIEVLDFDDMDRIVDHDAIDRFRARAMNSEHPTIRHINFNPDAFFQSREAANGRYNAVPDIVQGYMDEINRLTGRDYKLFNYYGAPDADRVVVAMCSVCGCAREVVEALNAAGEKVGLVQVHLYRPFSAKHLLAALPDTVKTVTTLDRTKEPGSVGEPLYEDVSTVLKEGGRNGVTVLAGRFGLGAKDTSPAQIKAVFDNMKGEKKNHFTLGINDDVTHLSLPVGDPITTTDKDTIECKFWGLGADGTVGANKNSIKIIGDNTDMYVQAYFEYDSKKSGGVTKSHLRFGKKPILSTYYVTYADFVACHNQAYVDRYDIVSEIKPGGTFLLNTQWSADDLDRHLPAKMKRTIAERGIKFYIIDAVDIAAEIGLGKRTNTVLQSAFFKLSEVLPIDDAVEYMKKAIHDTYFIKGDKILNMNYEAVDRGLESLVRVDVPDSWKDAKDEDAAEADASLPEFVTDILEPMNGQRGDSIPVSAFMSHDDGVFDTDTSKYEKRGVAVTVPEWIPENCIGCNLCSMVCPHATIRPFLFTEEEAKSAPEGCVTKKAPGKGMDGLFYRMQVDPLDCQGCASCVHVCPAKNKALEMKPLESQLKEQDNWDHCLALGEKKNPLDKYSVKGSQFEQPLFQFSGACAGCGETPYFKLLTQLFGSRMYVANATGCAQAVAHSTPSFPMSVDSCGHGPTVSNSLFENNAEFAFGMVMSLEQLREQMKKHAEAAAASTGDAALKEALEAWLESGDSSEKTREVSDACAEALKATSDDSADVKFLRTNSDQLVKKSVWMYGGDGWAYDIGYGGLDHIVATGADINALVVDNEVYANTGGQASKATQLGSVADFAAAGKRTPKKDLGAMLMNYSNVYVATVSMGADMNQLVKALKEAEAHRGPSVVIAYAPCINHGISVGMGWSINEEKLAVECGYWPLYRYNPETGEFSLDSKAPNGKLREFMMGEVRYSGLTRTFPEIAEKLFSEAEEFCGKRYAKYEKLAGK
ncbi:MAG: pyruvate:ferredoxin (flavodoxin) oxidoreductase [Anaerovoracaceae bacterium]